METGELNYNEIAANVITQNIDDILSFGKDFFKGTLTQIKLHIRQVYTPYLVNVANRYGKTRSFFLRDEPRELYSFYIPLDVSCDKTIIPEADLSSLLKRNKYSIIIGTGGSGKSIFLKHLLLNSLIINKKIPIFIELRNLNDTSISLYDYIKDSLLQFNLKIDSNFIDKAFKAGHFTLFLDGFDEIKTNMRKKIIKEIESYTKTYPGCEIIISSRHDNILNELITFSVYNTLPLSLIKSIKLIKLLPAEEEIKEKFVMDLENGLFEKHSSFLSNPLLLTIMLLTYGYSADIPNKLSIFYNQAYEALFQRHDALKGAFKRTKATNLDIQDFEKVLCSFCIQTYDVRKFQFTHVEALSFLENSKKLTSLSYHPQDYLQDLQQSICFLIEEGLFLIFIHRSFQEYFTAKFILNAPLEVKKQLVEKYTSVIDRDSVFSLLHEIDADFVEDEIILPFITNLFRKLNIKNSIGATHFLNFLNEHWSSFVVEGGKVGGYVKNAKLSNLVSFSVFTVGKRWGITDKFFNSNGETEYMLSLLEESKRKRKKIVFETKDLSSNDPFFKELYAGSNFFSKAILDILNELKNGIKQKRLSKKKSLKEILFNK